MSVSDPGHFSSSGKLRDPGTFHYLEYEASVILSGLWFQWETRGPRHLPLSGTWSFCYIIWNMTPVDNSRAQAPSIIWKMKLLELPQEGKTVCNTELSLKFFRCWVTPVTYSLCLLAKLVTWPTGTAKDIRAWRRLHGILCTAVLATPTHHRCLASVNWESEWMNHESC